MMGPRLLMPPGTTVPCRLSRPGRMALSGGRRRTFIYQVYRSGESRTQSTLCAKKGFGTWDQRPQHMERGSGQVQVPTPPWPISSPSTTASFDRGIATSRAPRPPPPPPPPPSPEEEFTFNAPSSRPLSDITIVALEQVISMPLATRHLSDLGARVIKIERPGSGDFVRHHDSRVRGKLCSHFVWINRNKESLALDIKAPRDREVLTRLLCDKADVFVQNLRPGDAQKMGLGYEQVKALMNDARPGERRGDRLIYASVSGYGKDGPYAHKKAYDLLIQAEAGLLSITGAEGEGGSGMAKVGCSIADIAAGMYAYSSILGAIVQRQKTGKGCEIDISMLEALVEWMGFPMYYAHEGQSGPRRAGASHASIYPYGPFSTGRGGKVMLGVQNEREWAVLATQVLQRPDLTTSPKFRNTAARSENRVELEAVISGIFAQWHADEVTARLDKAGIANAKVNDMQGVWEHPQLRARRRWRDVDSEVGPIKALLPPGMSQGVEARMDRIPAVGEHNERIFKELDMHR